MSRFAFIGGFYESQSKLADDQALINWYPEVVESGQGQTQMALYRTPGTKLFCSLGGVSVRGNCVINGRAFAVSGTNLYELKADGTVTLLSSILADDNQMVSMVSSPTQLLIASGGQMYVLTLGTNKLAPVIGNLGPVSLVGYSDSTFFSLIANSQKFQISNLNDATAWDPASVFQVEQFPDNVLSMIVDHREVWLFGLRQTIPYYDAGTFLNPWQPNGQFIEQGTVAQRSPVKLDNSIFWLGGDERGSGIAWRAQGYNPVRVSTHAVENIWQGYSTIADAIGYAYQDRGHSFWVLYFPTANATWVFDVATGIWHRRGAWSSTSGKFDAHHSRCHMFVFGKHLVGDWASGNIYDMNVAYLNDNGKEIRRIRRAPYISAELQWIRHNQLQLHADVGFPSALTVPTVGSGPTQILLKAPNNAIWKLTITDQGILNAVLSSGAPQTILINDQVNETTWLLGIDNTGHITLTPSTYVMNNQFFYLMTTPVGLESSITITNGIIATTTPAQAYRDPMVMLRWSDDGGNTWSNEHWASAGAGGNYLQRIIWRRLGRSRQRVYEVMVNDPVPWALVDAYLDASPGYEPQERLATQIRKGA